jgi:hypothetical protein
MTLEAFQDFVARGCEIVTGNLVVVGIAGLTDVTGLESVREVRGTLGFGYNPDLVSLVGAKNIKRTTFLNIEQNALLTSPLGLDSLEEVEQLYVTDNPHFLNFTGLERLKTVKILLHVDHDDALANFAGLSGLVHLGLGADDCPSLVDFSGLEGLQSATVLANRDAALRSFAGLEGLTNASFELTDCPSFEDLSALVGLTTVASFGLQNTGVASLHGAENITSADYVHLWDNPKLTDLTALSRLETVSVSLQVKGNATLGELSGFEQLKSIGGTLFVYENTELGALGFDHLTAVDGVEIYSNPKLPKCAVDALLDQVGTTCPMYCKGNDESAVCP